MKYLTLSLIFCISIFCASAQDKKSEEEKEGGFKKENLFTGGDLQLSFGSNSTNLGIGPFFGYSINKYIDVATSLNVNYASQRDYNTDAKLRQTNIGPGAFVRIFPVKFLFVQAQYEHNFIKQTYKYPSNFNYADEIAKFDVNSLLVGAGYAGGRDSYNKSFYYISILWDVAKQPNSPYTDNLNRAVPIFKAGYNIALFQKDRD